MEQVSSPELLGPLQTFRTGAVRKSLRPFMTSTLIISRLSFKSMGELFSSGFFSARRADAPRRSFGVSRGVSVGVVPAAVFKHPANKRNQRKSCAEVDDPKSDGQA